ncbi:hypothetical protein KCP73_10470 [Salmonella enterica subsp. enterica]|nr:hypothetical protein KCP73_10470 [Salmonella enterica subsp. enterica]
MIGSGKARYPTGDDVDGGRGKRPVQAQLSGQPTDESHAITPPIMPPSVPFLYGETRQRRPPATIETSSSSEICFALHFD